VGEAKNCVFKKIVQPRDKRVRRGERKRGAESDVSETVPSISGRGGGGGGGGGRFQDRNWMLAWRDATGKANS